jgi:glycosyltransferase involved in cell wall biosynthesis
MISYPRVLFVTPVAFNRISGGGVTFSNLFQGWPKHALATVHNDPETTLDDVCERYYVLGSKEIDLAVPFRYLRRGYRTTVKAPGSTGIGRRTSPFARLRSFVLRWFGDSFPERARLTPQLERWIAEFQPQVIYTILGSNGMMQLIEQIRVRFGLPLVVHIMDDWVSSYHRHGLLGPWQRRTMLRSVEHLVKVAKTRLGISPVMCDAYGLRYGRPFLAFQNAVDVGRWCLLSCHGDRISRPADILYTGSIFPNAQLDSLADCCRAVGHINTTGVAARLTIVTPREHAVRLEALGVVGPYVRIEKPIDDDDSFFRRIAQADVLLLPVNFDPGSVAFIRFSMPTKVPAYLAVGTPVLAYGPIGTAQIDYAIRDAWACVVSERGESQLLEGLRRILEDVQLRRSLSDNALNAAMRNHDSRTVRDRFHQVIRYSAVKGRE